MAKVVIKASVLVVSRTPALLNRFLRSLDHGYSGSADSIEVIVSWNGSSTDEALVEGGRLPLMIAQRDPYHFARNMNGLARNAKGKVLIFANDDLIIDQGAVDAALERLAANTNIGIVGARLRTSDDQLAHAGIHFTSDGAPYHQLERFANSDHPTNSRERIVPAVTGAFFAMRRNDFLELELTESLRVCGEDVLLSLQTRSVLSKQVLFCPAMSGIHDAESTRSQFDEQRGNDDDMRLMKSGWHEMIQRIDKESILIELRAVQDEAEYLREHCSKLNDNNEHQSKLVEQLRIQVAKQAQLEADFTQASLEKEMLERENKRLRSRIQQLENELNRSNKPSIKQ